jgi:sugar-specific transcriptional regulator TrmB
MNKDLFGSLGLTNNETKVYLSLLDLGSARVAQLTENSGVHRRNVYDSIVRLTKKGLISYVSVDKKRLYSPVNPKRFLEIADEKKHEIDKIKRDFTKILPELELKSKLKEKHDVRFYNGIEGLKNVFEGIIRAKKDYVGYGSPYQIREMMREYLELFTEKRRKNNIKARLIFSENIRSKLLKIPLCTIRFLPQVYSSHAAVRVFDDFVAIMLLTAKEPLAIVIKNRDISNGYRNYFEVMWRTAKYEVKFK